MSKETQKPEQKPTIEKSEFKLTPVKSKPSRKYRKGSKYDPILDAFIESDLPIVEVETDADANYVRTQLNKRIQARKIEKKVKISVVNNRCYLEKL